MVRTEGFLPPRAENMGRRGVRHHHIRVALQGVEVVTRKTFTRLGRHEHFAGALHQGLRRFGGQGDFCFVIQCFVQRYDEQRNGMQPREPRIVREQLQKMVRRGNRADVLLVAHALGIYQRLVQRQHRGAQFRELLPEIRSGNGGDVVQ